MLRKICRKIPRCRYKWASLIRHNNLPESSIYNEKIFEEPDIYWRLKGTWLWYYIIHQYYAQHIASSIAMWVKDFEPQVVWVLAEDKAVSVALKLLEYMQKVQLHLTFHDAPEAYAEMFGKYKWPVRNMYLSAVNRLVEKAFSIDMVSPELMAHMCHNFNVSSSCKTMCFPPSVDLSGIKNDHKSVTCNGPVKIGICGSPRESKAQFQKFLAVLAGMKRPVELIVYTDSESGYYDGLPGNVSLIKMLYASTEQELIRGFYEHGVVACYMGLPRDNRLFVTTSLSSKFPVYCACGVPVIMNGPEYSVAGNYIKKAGCGVILSDQNEEAIGQLNQLFANALMHTSMSQASLKLCENDFDLNKNIQGFVDLISF